MARPKPKVQGTLFGHAITGTRIVRGRVVRAPIASMLEGLTAELPPIETLVEAHSTETVEMPAETKALTDLTTQQLMALVMTLQSVPAVGIAQAVDVGEDTVLEWQTELFAGHIQMAHTALRDVIERGELGVVPMAKAHAEKMMGRLVELSQSKEKVETARRAAVDVLALAGHVPIRKAEVVNVNKIVDQMTPPELKRFIEGGEIPIRFRDQLTAAGKSAPKMIDVTPVE